MGEASDEVFCFGFFQAGIFHQLQNAVNGGLLKRLCHVNTQKSRKVHASADNVAARSHVAREAFSRESACVERGHAFQDGSVQRNPLSRPNHNAVSRFYLLRIHLDDLPITLHVGEIRANIHQGSNAAAALSDSVALKQLSNLIEKHDFDAFLILSQYQSADGGDRHQKVFIEKFAVQDPKDCFPQNIPADQQIRNQREEETGPAFNRKRMQYKHERGSEENADQDVFLFPVHFSDASSKGREGVGSTLPPFFTDKSHSRALPACRSE